VITSEDWALTRRLAAEGVPKARIADRLGVSRTTVIKAVGSDAPPRYERKPAVTSFTVFEPLVRAAGGGPGHAGHGVGGAGRLAGFDPVVQREREAASCRAPTGRSG
jgi:hypothetical protein